MSIQESDPSSNLNAAAEGDISLAVIRPSGRVDKILRPLETTTIDVDVDPVDAYERDIVLFDKPGREMVKPILKGRLANAKVVYRMRGDFYREYDLEELHPLKQAFATQVLLPRLDGCLAVCRTFADMIARRSRVAPVGVAGLPICPDDWPTVEHAGESLRLLTLTNAHYLDKIQPIIDFAPAVDRCLGRGDIWRVCGAGEYSDRLADALSQYNRIQFEGFADAAGVLAESNCMLHPSNLDGLPNSILEAMASKLPVITNDFRAFVEFDGPITTVSNDAELAAALKRARTPEWRESFGDAGWWFVQDNHTAETVGQQYVEFFGRVLSDE